MPAAIPKPIDDQIREILSELLQCELEFRKAQLQRDFHKLIASLKKKDAISASLFLSQFSALEGDAEGVCTHFQSAERNYPSELNAVSYFNYSISLSMLFYNLEAAHAAHKAAKKEASLTHLNHGISLLSSCGRYDLALDLFKILHKTYGAEACNELAHIEPLAIFLRDHEVNFQDVEQIMGFTWEILRNHVDSSLYLEVDEYYGINSDGSDSWITFKILLPSSLKDKACDMNFSLADHIGLSDISPKALTSLIVRFE